MTDLHTLGGTYGYATWLNDSGEIVGASTPQGDQPLLAFYWKDGAMKNLGTANGDACSVADAINSQGEVVGQGPLYRHFPQLAPISSSTLFFGRTARFST